MRSKTFNYEATIVNIILWTVQYVIVCQIVPVIINRMIWRNIFNISSIWFNISTLITLNGIFLIYLSNKYNLKISFLNNITIKGILLAICSSIFFYLLLDKFLDPIFDQMFPMSAIEYQEALAVLRQAPVANFIRVCFVAPVGEEILTRGYVLRGLQNKYGTLVAVVVSAILFAVIHFNFVQTLSALICGLVLGLLYIKTDSIFCCILAHALYNFISYFTAVL